MTMNRRINSTKTRGQNSPFCAVQGWSTLQRVQIAPECFVRRIKPMTQEDAAGFGISKVNPAKAGELIIRGLWGALQGAGFLNSTVNQI
jgi:hypothetical protein